MTDFSFFGTDFTDYTDFFFLFAKKLHAPKMNQPSLCSFQCMERHVVNHQTADVNLTAGMLHIYSNQGTVFRKIQYNPIRHFVALYTWSFSQMDIE